MLIVCPQTGKSIVTMHQGQPFCTYNRTLSRFERTPLHSRPLGCWSLCWEQCPYSKFLYLLSVRSCPPPLLSVWAGDLPAAVVAQDPASKLTPANCCWLFVGNNGRPCPSLRPRQDPSTTKRACESEAQWAAGAGGIKQVRARLRELRGTQHRANGCMPAQKALLRETEGRRLQTTGSLRRRWGDSWRRSFCN